ncbi:MAG: DUF975 family protein [Ruminococcaceae bacterium]|nr:DUF975 family protein [Oscillospiraceae bacterium]
MLLDSHATILRDAKAHWQQNAAHNRKIVLLYALPALSLPLLVMAINLFLDAQFAGTGGLSGIGMRSALETAQTVLSSAISVLLPFWQLGLFFAAMRISRGAPAQAQDLYEGFHRWGAALRLQLLRGMRYFAEILLGVFLGSLVYSVTPFSNGLVEAIAAITEDPTLANISSQELMLLLEERLSFSQLLPPYLFCIAGALILTAPLFYKYRLSDYVLLSSDKPGAFSSIFESAQLMQGNRLWLLRLDLRLWWYYLLMLLAALISYGDLLLPLLGISLPFSENISMVVFVLLSTAVQFFLYYFFRGRIETVYACVYEALKNNGKEEETSC